MSYSDKNRAWNRMQQSRHDARIQREIERAKELQRAYPGMDRDTALKQAAREVTAPL